MGKNENTRKLGIFTTSDIHGRKLHQSVISPSLKGCIIPGPISLSLSLSLGLVWWRREQRKGEREACVGGGKKVMCVVEKGKDKIR